MTQLGGAIWAQLADAGQSESFLKQHLFALFLCLSHPKRNVIRDFSLGGGGGKQMSHK